MDFASLPWPVLLFLGAMGLFALIAGSYVYYDLKTGMPTFPTMPAVRRKIAALLRDEMASQPARRPYTIIDLGSGSGQLTDMLARALPEAQIIGIELSFVPWLRSVLRQKLRGPANLRYLRRDFWSYDTAGSDAVIAYLLWPVKDRISAKLQAELRPGAVVLANTFPLNDQWPVTETFAIEAPFIAAASGMTNLYFYRKG